LASVRRVGLEGVIGLIDIWRKMGQVVGVVS
jgi:hypothetical protein